MSFYPELDQLDVEALLNRWQDPLPDNYDDPDLYYQEVAYALVHSGDPGITFLKNRLNDAAIQIDTSRLAATIWALGGCEQFQPALAPQLTTFLETDPRDSILLATIEACTNQNHTTVKALISEKLTHLSPIVRGSAMRYFNRLFPSEALPLVLQGLEDAHYIVRASAIDILDEGDYGIAPSDLRTLLEPFLTDPHPDVRQATETAIDHLSLQPIDDFHDRARYFDGLRAFHSQKYATAQVILRPFAEAGHAEAQCILGNLYEMGLGVPKDLACAIAWYQKASAQDYGIASNNLATMSSLQGEPAEIIQKWKQLARDQGFPHGPA
jgi:hypothetical protein